jgi:hypothetical protein
LRYFFLRQIRADKFEMVGGQTNVELRQIDEGEEDDYKDEF